MVEAMAEEEEAETEGVENVAVVGRATTTKAVAVVVEEAITTTIATTVASQIIPIST